MSKYFTPYPPMNIHSSTPVTIEEAHSIVSQYIKQAESDRSLHPNAILTDDGPTKSLSGGADDRGGSSLVWHNMHRVEAGLRGEYLQPQPLDLPSSKTTMTAAMTAAATAEDADDAVVPATPTKPRPAAMNGTPNGKRKAGWQDPDEYRQEQQEVEGDVGDRMQGMVQGREAAANLAPVEAKVDKAERKRSKKERHRAEKKQRAKDRQEAAAA